jgi:hypothetical protein
MSGTKVKGLLKGLRYISQIFGKYHNLFEPQSLLCVWMVVYMVGIEEHTFCDWSFFFTNIMCMI